MNSLTINILMILSLGGMLIGCEKAQFSPLMASIPDANFVPTPSIDDPSNNTSWMLVSHPNTANGVNPAIVTLTLKTESGAPILGAVMMLEVSGQDNVVQACGLATIK